MAKVLLCREVLELTNASSDARIISCGHKQSERRRQVPYAGAAGALKGCQAWSKVGAKQVDPCKTAAFCFMAMLNARTPPYQ